MCFWFYSHTLTYAAVTLSFFTVCSVWLLLFLVITLLLCYISHSPYSGREESRWWTRTTSSVSQDMSHKIQQGSNFVLLSVVLISFEYFLFFYCFQLSLKPNTEKAVRYKANNFSVNIFQFYYYYYYYNNDLFSSI